MLWCTKKFWGGFEHTQAVFTQSYSLDERCSRKDKYTNFNTNNQEQPPIRIPLRAHEPVNFYKSYLREKLNDGLRNVDAFNMYEKIDENSEVQNTYNVIAFAQELQSLEKHFYSLNNEIDFIPIYESFLKRLEIYSKSNTADVKSLENKKVLGWLYTAALSKIQGLKSDRYSNLVIDIQTYLDPTKVEIINKYKDEYKNELDAKVNEATTFINKTILPEIDNIFDGLITQ